MPMDRATSGIGPPPHAPPHRTGCRGVGIPSGVELRAVPNVSAGPQRPPTVLQRPERDPLPPFPITSNRFRGPL